MSTKAISKYNNMVEAKTWNVSSGDKDKIIALTTQVNELKKKISSKSSTSSSDGPKQLNIAEWRKTKSFGDSVQKDGKLWHLWE